MSKRINEIVEGLFRIGLVAPGHEVTTKVNCFLIRRSDDEFILVDSGWRFTGKVLVGAIKDEFGQGVKIRTIFISHLHPDHYGGVGAVRESFRCKVIYHRKEAIIREKERYLSWIDGLSVPRDVFEYVSERADSRISAMPVADEFLEGGAIFKSTSGEWSVIHTPGHTPGHLCLFQKERRVLISGDHLLPNKSSNVGFYPLRGYNPLHLYLLNLTRTAALRPSLVVPSHGEPFDDAKGRVKELFVHHRERLREVFDGLESGTLTPAEAARCIHWSRGSFETLEGFDRWLAITEALSHLEFLRGAGVATRRSKPRFAYELVTKDRSVVERAVDELAESPTM